MNKSELRVKLKKERFDSGLCVYCGVNPFAMGKRGCDVCLKNKYTKQLESIKKDNYKHVKLYRLKKRQEVVEKYGGKCRCCGEHRLPFLTIDHVNNDGASDRKELYGSQKGCSLKWYLKLCRESPRDDLQVLCWNCNAAKSHFGECPHQNGLDKIDFTLLEIDRRRKKDFNICNKINWPEDNKLVNMVNQSNCSEVARQLGVHDTAIRGRLKRRNLYDKVIKMNRKKQIRENFRNAVFERDGRKCVMCGKKDTKLDAHHIETRDSFVNGGYVKENGITLCAGDDKDNCHWKAEQYHATGTALPGFSPEELFKKINSSLDLAMEKANVES